MSFGTLYLIPCTIGGSIEESLPVYFSQKILEINCYAVEEIRTARRFLRALNREIVIDDLTFFEIGKKAGGADNDAIIKQLKKGNNVGMLSEAGCPGIADPGSIVVQSAHRNNIKVKPLVGPSSLILALMASGLSGQNFQFHGYLPIDKNDAARKIGQLEKDAISLGKAQLFIETPFRNQKIAELLLQTCRKDTLLCIATDLTLPNEFVRTLPISDWTKQLPNFHKKPTVFIIGSAV